MSARLPPVAWLALAFASGAGLVLGEAPLPPPPLLAALLLAAPIALWLRPTPRAALATAVVAGGLWTQAWLDHRQADCRLHLEEGAELSLEGRFEGRPTEGGVPFRVDAGLPHGCRVSVRVFLDSDAEGGAPDPGRPARIEGRWRTSPHPHPLHPERAGYLAAHHAEATGSASGTRPALEVRGHVQGRVGHLYGPGAPLVEALLLARREALDPELREAFVLSGTAHLLAISGFHVGVIAGLLFGLARLAGAGRTRASLLSAAGSWIYVVGIGIPYAAARAATIVTFLAVGRLRGRPVDPAGALSSAFLLVLVADPGALAEPGFQLSFAGAGGLVLLYRPIRGWLDGVLAPVRPRVGESLPGYLAAGTAAGLAATLPTLPLVAWHFDRASLVGIPVTLVLAPLVSMALPGVLASLVLDAVWTPAGRFLAGGVALLLELASAVARLAAEIPGAAPWVPRSWFVAVPLGVAPVLFVLRATGWDRRCRRAVRSAAALGGAGVVVLLWPLLLAAGGRAPLEIHVVDVGQGDGIAIRSPAGRWLLVDAGPRSDRFDAGERRMVPHLRRSGARAIEAVIMTHPHLDHIGGVPAVLDDFPVGALVDPGWVAPSPAWLEILRRVAAGEAGWWTPRAGDRFELDGVRFDVLHPREEDVADPEVRDANHVSIVLLVRWGDFTALLTGDAYRETEVRLGSGLPRLDLLKLGHHGSRTSTDGAFLDAARPRKAAVSLGRRNLYGHPHREVTRRLEERDIALYRTDRHGTVVIRVDPRGGVEVRTERGRP